MKTVITENGWQEIETKTFQIERKVKEFQPVSHWIDYVNRNPKMNFGGRNHCECCKRRWTDLPPEMMTYFAMTNKGNKVLCQECWDKF